MLRFEWNHLFLILFLHHNNSFYSLEINTTILPLPVVPQIAVDIEHITPKNPYTLYPSPLTPSPPPDRRGHRRHHPYNPLHSLPLSPLPQIAVDIEHEAHDHNRLLDGIDGDFGAGSSLMGGSSSRLAGLMSAGRQNRRVGCYVATAVVALVILCYYAFSSGGWIRALRGCLIGWLNIMGRGAYFGWLNQARHSRYIIMNNATNYGIYHHSYKASFNV